ncbi:MAG: 30S ribosomal protein S15 [Bdellovibrionales bacterium]|nr:30S ribosomal protein S15 [Bdellovibrionales bacterium]
MSSEEAANNEVKPLSANRAEVVKQFQQSATDTGSPEVQVAVLTQRLEKLNKHFENHKLDVHSRRGLLRIVSKRKRLLGYLKKENITRYRALISELGLRK